MFRNYEWKVALKYLSIRGHDGFVTVIALFSLFGIFLGVGALIVTMSVMGGFREELLGKVIGFNGHVLYQPFGGKMSDYDAAANELSNVKNVVRVRPILEGQAMAMMGDNGTFALVRGIRAEDLRSQELVSSNIVLGSLDKFGDGEDDIVIGQRLAERYGLEIGSDVTLMSPKGRITAFGTVPRIQQFTVIAIFEVGEFNYDSNYFFVPLDAAQIYFQYGDQVGGLEVTLTHADMVNETYPELSQRIVDAGLSGRVLDWQQLNRAFFNALQIEKNAMFIILSLIILVAVFNVISTMIMLVKSKTRDIAVLRTMGASRASITRIFFIIGSSIGFIGTFLGVVGGIYLANHLQWVADLIEAMTGATIWDAETRFISEIPAQVDNSEVIAVTIVALILSLLATIFPALRAANTDPVKALKYE
ncbi:MAG: lipoprotein-releasing ABC transporter permease subunit [Kordiimonadaceae bacterium]|jgi:lipoprotein-releasing system permease protein|nr:lipoprotein-releasing ABC transporter permease subunit [Kordiimonadaceae bacterium]MBT6037162.1 lipoprotein-releasing ABC transporter permease subunit [Kordiimonadaceae bacterium]MBT6329998.1 lipoprotein-releasing ABC transporter permease subunit [Kordiimonadaceae bacterium]MBT7583634.1 lipoprotein-releasing ABC transporter permease subunit [Kordiimonadaceae bacterium]